MAKVRIGFSTQFELENELVGIGTDNPTNTLQALGNISSSDAKAIGVSTLTAYQGFVDSKAAISGAGGSKSGSISDEIIIEGTVNVSSGTTFTSGPENLTITDNFTLPGISDDRPTVGTTRFNENLASLEFYTGVEWKAVNSVVDVSGGGGRGVWGGGYVPTVSQVMDYVNIPTQGNAIMFGDLNAGGASKGDMGSNGSRGLFMGGYWPAAPSKTNQIDYITIPSGGNGTDFGDITGSNGWGPQGASSSTRGIRMGGYPACNIIDYVEISTVGNAIDFGDLTRNSHSVMCCSSPIKVFGGAGNSGTTYYSRVDMIITASKGNSVNNGDLTQAKTQSAAASNSTRGLWFGGNDANNTFTDVQYINLSSSGKAQYFGELTQLTYKAAAAASQTRAVLGGGTHTDPASVNTIQYVTIASSGNAIDFGDLTQVRRNLAAVSDSHGGLGGF